MKYFAILKDSFREALDSKVLYLMFSLSTIVILIVATLSFKPMSAQKTMELFFPDQKLGGLSLMFLALNNQELRRVEIDPNDMKAQREVDGDDVRARMAILFSYRLEKVELLNGEADSPESDYVLTIADSFGWFGKDDQKEALAKGAANVRTIFQRAEELGFLKIGAITGEVEARDEGIALPPRTRYRVTLHGNARTFRIWGNEPSLGFGAVPLTVVPPSPLAYQLYVLSRLTLLFGAWVAVIVGVVITSFFVPNMLAKGTIDLLLVKPIHRWVLLSYKYVGGLTFIFLNTAYAVVGLWLVIGLRSGLWPNGSLLLIVTITFFFGILYAISMLVGVITRSNIAAIIVTIGAWFVFFLIGMGHDKISTVTAAEAQKQKRGQAIPPGEGWSDSRTAVSTRTMHAITPRTEDLNHLNDLILYCDFLTGNIADMGKFDIGDSNWLESLLIAAVWIVVFLGASCFWFTVTDY